MDIHLSTHHEFLAKFRASMTGLTDRLPLSDSLPVIAAVSGGPDSTAMLLSLKLLSRELNLSVRACHVNHQLRGHESDQDEEYCRQFCDVLGIPLDVCRENNLSSSVSSASSPSEAQLRATRYDFLYFCAEKHNCNAIILAHTQDDQIETMLFRLFRGTSISGLTGIRPSRRMKNGIWLLRPMLNSSRSETLKFLDAACVVARVDSSNQDSRYARNFLRNQVLPLCLSRFPTLTNQLERLRQLAATEDEYLDSMSDSLIKQLAKEGGDTWDLQVFLAHHLALQRRVLVKSFADKEIEVSYERIEAVLNMMAEGDPSRISLDQNWDVMVGQGRLHWLKWQAMAPSRALDAINFKVPGSTVVASLGKVFKVEVWTGGVPEDFPQRTELTALVDLSHAELPLILRSRKEGDSICPLGMSQAVTLKKYIHTHKTEAYNCSVLKGTVLCDQKEVLWVVGLGLSEKIKVQPGGIPTHLIQTLEIAADVTIA